MLKPEVSLKQESLQSLTSSLIEQDNRVAQLVRWWESGDNLSDRDILSGLTSISKALTLLGERLISAQETQLGGSVSNDT